MGAHVPGRTIRAYTRCMWRLARHPRGSIGAVVCSAYFGAGWSLTHVAAVSATSSGHKAAWLLLFALFALSALASSAVAITTSRRVGRVAVRLAPLPLLVTLAPLAAAEVISPIQGIGHIDADLIVVLMILIQTLAGIASVKFGRACIRIGIEILDARASRARGTSRCLAVCGEAYDEVHVGRLFNRDEWGRPPPCAALIA